MLLSRLQVLPETKPSPLQLGLPPWQSLSLWTVDGMGQWACVDLQGGERLAPMVENPHPPHRAKPLPQGLQGRPGRWQAHLTTAVHGSQISDSFLSSV